MAKNKKKTKFEKTKHFALCQSVPMFVSEDDLSHPLTLRVIEEGVKNGDISPSPSPEEVLYKVWGLNTEVEFDQECLTHKTRFGKVVTAIRYSGFERYDEEWLKSPIASKQIKESVESYDYHARIKLENNTENK